MLAKKLQQAVAGQAAGGAYIEDVFSTYLFNGNGSTQTITNGIDFDGEGGLVWIKGRDAAWNHFLLDTERGPGSTLFSHLTLGAYIDPTDGTEYSISSFNSNGFSLKNNDVNNSARKYASWSFRKAPKFFDVVTYTGTGPGSSANEQQVSHNLGSKPGVVIIKRTDTTGDWWVFTDVIDGSNDYAYLNTTAAFANSGNNVPTASVFNVGGVLNASGGTYVAYLFAHDAGGFGDDGEQNVISCGSLTTDGSGTATVNLGYEPQFLILKRTDNTGNWVMLDTMRGWENNTSGADAWLEANTSDAEVFSIDFGTPTATGFIANGAASSTYIYIAIRRGPMKTPESGTEVFKSLVYTGNETNRDITGVGFAPDLVIGKPRDDVNPHAFYDRIRGATKSLRSTSTNAEATYSDAVTGFDLMDGISVGADLTEYSFNWNGKSILNTYFRRAPGFFDVVCYTGTGSARTVSHNLTVPPELMIVKCRSNSGTDWLTYSVTKGNTWGFDFNGTTGFGESSSYWNNTSPTATEFTVATDDKVNYSGYTYVAYLFASVDGVSKVGSYTGETSTTKSIDCGFSNGARFVLIKRIDSAGYNWYVWDTARGIISGDDPYLLTNSTAAEVTNTDYIDPYSAGFQISSSAPAGINENGGTYIFLAIA